MKSVLRNLVFTVVLTIMFFFGGVEAHSYIEVAVPDTSAEHGDTIAIPVTVSNVTGEEIYAFQMTLTFDSLVLTADSAYSTGTISEPWGSPIFNDSIPGEIRIAMAGVYPLSGSGVLVYVVFKVEGSQGNTTTIHFDEMVFNEGDPASITSDGLFEVVPGSDVEDEDEFPGRPAELTLFQNYPNPFNPQTAIQYTLPHDCKVEIAIYNILGQRVKTLVNEQQRAGYKRVEWDGKNDRGEQVASGIYFYRIEAGEFTKSKKMEILK